MIHSHVLGVLRSTNYDWTGINHLLVWDISLVTYSSTAAANNSAGECRPSVCRESQDTLKATGSYVNEGRVLKRQQNNVSDVLREIRPSCQGDLRQQFAREDQSKGRQTGPKSANKYVLLWHHHTVIAFSNQYIPG